MKSHLLYAMAGCLLALMLPACNKDQGPSQNNEEASSSLTDPIHELRRFHEHLEQAHAHPDTKNDETMSLEQALWDVENHFNLTYTDSGEDEDGPYSMTIVMKMARK